MLNEIGPLARAGVCLHWLKRKSKAPVSNSWSTAPKKTLAQLKESYREGYNVGIRLGKLSKVGGYYLHALDVDIRDAEYEQEAIRWLTDHVPGWRKLPFVRSGSGGKSRHIYFLTDRPFTSRKLAHSADKFTDEEGKKHWMWEVELFGTGKQVAAPPSIHPDTGKKYTWGRELDLDDLDMGLGPILESSLIESLRGDDAPAAEGDRDPLDRSDEQIKDTLSRLDLDEWCVDRDGWLKVGMALHHQYGGSKEGLKIWNDFSRQAEGKFDAHENRYQWRRFKDVEQKTGIVTFRTMERAVREAEEADIDIDDLGDDLDAEEAADGDLGITDLGDDEDAPEKPRKAKKDKGGKVPSFITEINKKYALAIIGGKTVILHFRPGKPIGYGSVDGLHQIHENKRVVTEKSSVPASKKWMMHKGRREYLGGVVFEPNPSFHDDEAYNLWTGFAVQPDAEASCSRILWHIRNVICGGVKAYADYLIGWMAHMIQRPWDKPGVAVILRGNKGTGKDTLGDYLSDLMPEYYVKIANGDHLTGKFNAHLQRCLFLHVEEAFFAGDKKGDGILKNLITAKVLTIEPKGVDSFNISSYLRLMMTANERWVVPATGDERRYFVLDVPDIKRQDRAYFGSILKERANGGPAALLHYLQHYDLSGFDVGDVPNTEALGQQKIENMKNVERWWYEALAAGEFTEGDGMPTREQWDAGSIAVNTLDLREAYKDRLRERRWDGVAVDASEFGREMMRFTENNIERKLQRTSEGRKYVYLIPDLHKCRQAFARVFDIRGAWTDIEAQEALEHDDVEAMDDLE